MKKVFGYIFIVLAILLSLTIIGQMPRVLTDLVGLLQVFTGSLDEYESGKAFGKAFLVLLHIALIIVFWFYGRKWIRKKF